MKIFILIVIFIISIINLQAQVETPRHDTLLLFDGRIFEEPQVGTIVITGNTNMDDVLTPMETQPPALTVIYSRSYLSSIEICGDITNLGPDPVQQRSINGVVRNQILPDGSVISVSTQALVSETNKLWDVGKTLKIKFFGGTHLMHEKVLQYAHEWELYANILFVPTFGNDADIRITFDPTLGFWSAIGTDAASWYRFGSATMNFAWSNDNISESEFSRKILHEFGHALGFVHEHQSPVAGIAWNKEKVYQKYSLDYGWSKETIDQNVFEKYSYSETQYSQYDPNSIMHYPIPAELTIDGYSSSWNIQLSDIDKQYAGYWYPKPPLANNTNGGPLRTGDDCDEIDFYVEYNAVDPNYLEFVLKPGYQIDWWKSITIPGYGNNYEIEIQDGSESVRTINVTDIDYSQAIGFSKAKSFGVHTRLSYTWEILQYLPQGTRVTFIWKRDSCN